MFIEHDNILINVGNINYIEKYNYQLYIALPRESVSLHFETDEERDLFFQKIKNSENF